MRLSLLLTCKSFDGKVDTQSFENSQPWTWLLGVTTPDEAELSETIYVLSRPAKEDTRPRVC